MATGWYVDISRLLINFMCFADKSWLEVSATDVYAKSLVHRRPETTMIYTHISTEKIRNLANPPARWPLGRFDELVQEEIESLRGNGNNVVKKVPLPRKNFGIIDTFNGTYKKFACIK